MKLKAPKLYPKDGRCETRYLTHCTNIAGIFAHSDSVRNAQAKIQEYLRVIGAIQEDKNDQLSNSPRYINSPDPATDCMQGENE